MNALIPRATVDEIVARRNRALTLYGEAAIAIGEAAEALKRAGTEAEVARAGGLSRYNHHQGEQWRKLVGDVRAPDPDQFSQTARRLVDTDFWAHVLVITDLEMIMDKQAKDEFAAALQENPPEFTVENVVATLETFAGQAKMVFQRGIANTFSKLDRRFRSHDGWKIGSRVILSYAFDSNGLWNYNRNHRDTFQDIERAFLILDDRQPVPTYAGLVAAVSSDRGNIWKAHQSFIETEFFRVRVFKNGNAHIWFKRDDLVEKVNKQLAEYYGEVIPEDREPDADDGGLNNPKTSLAKNYGFFPTPDATVENVLHRVPLYRAAGEPKLEILEPSAGTGQLARRLVRTADDREAGTIVDCVEIQQHLARGLERTGRFRSVICADFLKLAPVERYDLVVMNPPFDRERDIDHVMHALKWLKPDGVLVAIMSAGTEFRETRKSAAFRAYIERLNGQFSDLPPGSFSSVGTNVNTLVLKVRKSGGRIYW